jgi:hypothetical protein
VQVNARLRIVVAAIAAAGAACSLAAAGPNAGGGKQGTTKRKAGAAGSCAAQANKDPWPFLDAPADPWRAVADGKPIKVVLDERAGGAGERKATCDAAHDHCLRDCTWLIAQPHTASPGKQAVAFHLGTDGAWHTATYGDENPEPGFIAYRTVPATRKNLAVGQLVFAVAAPARVAGGTGTGDRLDLGPLDAIWDTGMVESIDWDAGLVRLEGRTEPYFLSVTRIAALAYTDGAAAVEAIEGVDATAPAVADVIQPMPRKRSTTDPWSQVGKTKQPLAAAAPTARLTGFADDCSAATDHCLAPWVWFVDVGNEKLIPARWSGKKFVTATDSDPVTDSHGLAYRTRPAKDADIKVGAKLAIFDGTDPPPSEAGAHARRGWIIGKVTAVDHAAKEFEIDSDSAKHPNGNARVLVVYWLPGEDAAAVE